jgi:SulP family sulfate permease
VGSEIFIRDWVGAAAPQAITFQTLRELLPGAFSIAMLGAIESLLSAVVADGMARTRHDPDAELLALGVGNLVAPFFGGIPATGALARTATNVRSGARSPVAAMTHAVVVLVAVLALAPVIGYLPMPALAALLLLVAWNMSEVKHFLHIVRVAPKSDVTVLLTCFGLTVVFDMVIAVSVGIVLAALLFMRRMAEVAQARLIDHTHPAAPRQLPPGVVIYDIDGPMFFGAAQRAMAALGIVGKARAVIIRMEGVPVMDATGLVALESALAELHKRGARVYLIGLQAQPRQLLTNARQVETPGQLMFRATLDQALAELAELAEGPGT